MSESMGILEMCAELKSHLCAMECGELVNPKESSVCERCLAEVHWLDRMDDCRDTLMKMDETEVYGILRKMALWFPEKVFKIKHLAEKALIENRRIPA